MITTSRSAVSAFQRCPRLRYWQYEAPNGTDTPGWESRKLAIPLVTGIYVHQGLAEALLGASASEAAAHAKAMYMEEVGARGLQRDEGDGDEQAIIDEQSAHVEALVLAWCRVRLPRWQEEFEVVAVEQEDRIALSDDVVLAVRQDAIVRRKADGRMFVVNFKTVAQADERWMRQWETDMQIMTELLAAEARYGEQFGGVIIEGLVKGQRVGVDQWLKEVRGDDAKDKVHARIDRSRLLYGYKTEGDPPLTPKQYDWAGTTRKGWKKFRTWKEDFSGLNADGMRAFGASPIDYWVRWLPEEVVEQCFAIVPPILRDASRIESCVRQIVAIEQDISNGTKSINFAAAYDATEGHIEQAEHQLDRYFPQNGHSCIYPTRCGMFDMCWSAGISDDPTSLYRTRVDHHQEVTK